MAEEGKEEDERGGVREKGKVTARTHSKTIRSCGGEQQQQQKKMATHRREVNVIKAESEAWPHAQLTLQR